MCRTCSGEHATGERIYSEGEDASAGFPGWHIECSAMSRKFLGLQIDIHGWEDNIFRITSARSRRVRPSAAKTLCAALGPPLSYPDGEEKMSLGNVLSLPDVIHQGFSPLDLRTTFSWSTTAPI